MKISEAFPSKYLKADDLGGREVTITIDKVERVDVGTEAEPQVKPVLYFRDHKKGLVMNVTNATTMRDAYGDETDGWRGKEVILYATPVDFKGQRVPGLRVRVPVTAVFEDEEPGF